MAYDLFGLRVHQDSQSALFSIGDGPKNISEAMKLVLGKRKLS
jgi:hypothetical protein